MAAVQGHRAVGIGVTANSTTWVDVATIASGDFTAGHKYLILAAAFVRHASSANEVRMRLVHGTTPTEFTDASLAYELTSNTQETNPGWMTVYTQPGTTEAVTLQVSVSATNTATVEWGGILAIDLDTGLTENTDYWYNEVTSDYSTTSTNTAQASVTFTPNGTDTFLLLGTFDIIPAATGSNYKADLYDSVTGVLTVTDAEGEDVSNETRGHTMASVLVPSSASHTFSVRLGHESTTHTVLSSRIFVLRLDAFDQFVYALNASQQQPAASPSWTTTATVSPTPNVTGDWVVLGYYADDVGTITDDLATRLRINPDGGGLASDPAYSDSGPGTEGWDDTDILPVSIFTLAELDSGAARTINLDVSLVSGTALRVQDRLLVAFSLELAGEGGGGGEDENITLGGSIASGETFYTPIAEPGTVVALVPFISSAETHYAIAALGGDSGPLLVPQIASAGAFYQPTAAAGAVSVVAGFISSGGILYQPTFNQESDETLLVPLLGSGAVFYTPRVSGGSVLRTKVNNRLIRVGIDLDGDRWINWEGRTPLNRIEAAVWFPFIEHGEVNATAADRMEKTNNGLFIRRVTGGAVSPSYTRLGTNNNPAVSVSVNTTYTVVVWARSVAVSAPAKIVLYDQDGEYLATSAEVTVGNNWTRLALLYTTPGSGVTGLQVAVARGVDPVSYAFDLTGFGVYSGATNMTFNSGLMPGQTLEDDVLEDVTEYVLSVNGDSGTNDEPTALVPTEGQLHLQLNNETQIWTPRNSDSPFYGRLLPTTIIEVQISEGRDDNWKQLWTGFYSSISISTGSTRDRQATITGVQGLIHMSDLRVSYVPETDKTATEIISSILLDVPLPSDRYSWQLGISILGIDTYFVEPDAVTNLDDSEYEYPTAGVGLGAESTVREFFDALVINEGGFAFYDRLGRPTFRTRDALVPGPFEEE